jgi:hypothetical protein
MKLNLLIFLISIIGVTGCLPMDTSIPIPTETHPATQTPVPTATVIWFPPTATLTPFPTIQITPTPNLRPDLGEIILRDDFSSGVHWSLGQTTTSSVALGINELSIALSGPRVYAYTMRDEPVLGDFYVEITASPTLCQGNDEYGLLLRMTSPADFYRYSLSCNGKIRLDRLVAGQASSPQPWMQSGTVPPGAPSISRLAAWIYGKEMRFFVNDTYQFTVKDPLLASGNIGVFARSAGENAVTVSFSELLVRKISK